MKPIRKSKRKKQTLPQASTVQLPFDPPVVDTTALRTIPYVMPDESMRGQDPALRFLAASKFFQDLYSQPNVQQAVLDSFGGAQTQEDIDWLSDYNLQVGNGDYAVSSRDVPALKALIEMYPNSPNKTKQDLANLYIRHRTDPMATHIQKNPNPQEREGYLGYVMTYGAFDNSGSISNPAYMGLNHIMKRGNKAVQANDDSSQSIVVHEAAHASDPYTRFERSAFGRLLDQAKGSDTSDSAQSGAYVFKQNPRISQRLISEDRPELSYEEAEFLADYFSQPTEIKSRLMELRYALKDLKLGDYSSEDLDRISPSSRAGQALQELRYVVRDDEELIRALNIAY